jgi:hypothetical protein
MVNADEVILCLYSVFRNPKVGVKFEEDISARRALLLVLVLQVFSDWLHLPINYSPFQYFMSNILVSTVNLLHISGFIIINSLVHDGSTRASFFDTCHLHNCEYHCVDYLEFCCAKFTIVSYMLKMFGMNK